MPIGSLIILTGRYRKPATTYATPKPRSRPSKDLSQIKGVGQWILRLMNGFFPEASSDSSLSKNVSREMGKETKGKALLTAEELRDICLTDYPLQGNDKWDKFMKKQQLIDAAEASGLSRTSKCAR